MGVRQGLLLANDDLCAFLSKEEGRTSTDSLCERPRGWGEGFQMFRWVIVKPNGSFHTCAAPDEREMRYGFGHLAHHRMKKKKKKKTERRGED